MLKVEDIMQHITIEEFTRNELEDEDFNWSDGHWWSDWEEAGIEKCFVALDIRGDERVVGFLTMNADRQCVAIEVHPEYRLQGIAKALVREAWCFEPEQNYCPDFWIKAQQWKDENDDF